jgi:hypothetical protein
MAIPAARIPSASREPARGLARAAHLAWLLAAELPNVVRGVISVQAPSFAQERAWARRIDFRGRGLVATPLLGQLLVSAGKRRLAESAARLGRRRSQPPSQPARVRFTELSERRAGPLRRSRSLPRSRTAAALRPCSAGVLAGSLAVSSALAGARDQASFRGRDPTWELRYLAGIHESSLR